MLLTSEIYILIYQLYLKEDLFFSLFLKYLVFQIDFIIYAIV